MYVINMFICFQMFVILIKLFNEKLILFLFVFLQIIIILVLQFLYSPGSDNYTVFIYTGI